MREYTLDSSVIKQAIERRESLDPRWTDGLPTSEAARAQIYRYLELALLHYAAESPWEKVERKFDEASRWVPTFAKAYEWERSCESTPNRNAAALILHGTIAGVLGSKRDLEEVVDSLGRMQKTNAHAHDLGSIAEAYCLCILSLNYDKVLDQALRYVSDTSQGMLAVGEYDSGAVRETLKGIAHGNERHTSEGLNDVLRQYARVRNELAHSPRWKDTRSAQEYFCLYATALTKLAHARGIATHVHPEYEHFVPQELAEH